MKTLMMTVAIVFSLQAFASEKDSFDACAHFKKSEAKIVQELSELYSRSGKLERSGQYPDNSYDDDNCEEPMDEPTYVAQRIVRVRKQLGEVRRSIAENCYSERYPE